MISVPIVIAGDHPAFAGHFPARPVVPGVVLLDESLRAIGRDRRASAPLRISTAKFLSMVVPGDPVRLEYDESGTTMTLRVFAGSPGAERLAMSGIVVFAARPEGD